MYNLNAKCYILQDQVSNPQSQARLAMVLIGWKTLPFGFQTKTSPTCESPTKPNDSFFNKENKVKEGEWLRGVDKLTFFSNGGLCEKTQSKIENLL